MGVDLLNRNVEAVWNDSEGRHQGDVVVSVCNLLFACVDSIDALELLQKDLPGGRIRSGRPAVEKRLKFNGEGFEQVRPGEEKIDKRPLGNVDKWRQSQTQTIQVTAERLKSEWRLHSAQERGRRQEFHAS